MVSVNVYVYVLIGLCIWAARDNTYGNTWNNLAELVWCIFAWPMVVVVPVFRYAMLFFSNGIYWTLLSNQLV